MNRGERPAPEQVVGIFWAKGDGVFWTRQTRTWDLPSLTGVYAHRFTFKYIYSAWTTFPLVVKTQRRGRNAEGSASDKWMGNILQMRKEAAPFLDSLGIPKPRSKAEWSYIFKEMGTFLAAKNFIVNCPLPVMELPVAPVRKEALRFRAVCDERITVPLSSLRAFDSVYTKLVAGLSKSSMVEIKVNWRCNVVHDWVEPVPQKVAGALYDRLGFSQDLIMQLGCSPPLGALAPGRGGQGIGPQGQDSGGNGHHAPHAGPGHQKVPPDHHVHCHGGRGQEVHQQALPDGNQARVRPCPAQHQRMGSGGQGEVQDHRGLHVQVLQGLLEGEPRGDPAAPDYGVAQGQGHLPAAGDGRAPGAAI